MDSPLSFTGKRWALQENVASDGIVAFLKHQRNIDDSSENDSWYDPSRYPDAVKAAERVLDGIKRTEKIAVFGDYDCDGITATAQMLRALRRRGAEPIVRLPHRVHDGYGLKPAHIDEFANAYVTLLITVDTGISAQEAVAYAKTKKIDVIILDHHSMHEAPNAFAILHPALAPNFPEPHPSAAGVVFHFLHALEGDDWEGRDIDLSLAMFGTVADLVPLQSTNRRLVQEGLSALRRLPNGPLKTFTERVSNGSALTSTDVAFRIAPRINAAGRMADPMLALRAILEGGPLLEDLDTLNALRQAETQRALDHAMTEMIPDKTGELPPFLTIASHRYPHGILGLLAGKLTEKYGRPSMAVHISGDLCTASLRSPPSYNIVEALRRIAPMLVSFGGHAQAGGATFMLDQYIKICEALESDAAQHIPAEMRIPSLMIDAELSLEAVTTDFCAELRTLEPFGQGNPEPMFLLSDVKLENARRVGTEGRHLQATIGHCKVIGFGLGPLLNESTHSLDVACKVGIDTWNGIIRPQLMIQDIRATKRQDTKNKRQIMSTLQGPIGD